MLYYIDARELKKNAPFLNFDRNELEGHYNNYSCQTTPDLASIERNTVNEEQDGDRGTIGIHARGCGIIPPSQNKMSVYDYVTLIQKAASAEGKTLTKQDIYNGSYDADIQNYVEDLIIDEMALELAFEGTRFFDLMRVAHRRNDNSYLAERVSKRSGVKDMALYSKLLSRKNWYFPLPQK